MEDRVTSRGTGRPGPALVALLAILVITAAWWALALWPAGALEPEWLARTRLACFGSVRGGLPDAGGWVLLIGEPVGLLTALLVVWGHSLQAELARVRRDNRWRLAAAALSALAVAGVGALGVHVSRALALSPPSVPSAPGVTRRLDVTPPATVLTDQQGRRVSLADLRGHPVLLTFTFGHCATFCPAIVNDLRLARREANRLDIRIAVLTLDPWRDTPERLPSLVSHWGLGPDDRVLSGGVDEVGRTLDALGVGRRRDETTGDIEHGATVMLMNDRGRIAWRLDGGSRRVGELLRSEPPPP